MLLGQVRPINLGSL